MKINMYFKTVLKYILSDMLNYILNLNLSIILIITFLYYNNFKIGLTDNFLKFFLKFFKCLV